MQKKLWGSALLLLFVSAVIAGNFYSASRPLPNAKENKVFPASGQVAFDNIVVSPSQPESHVPPQNENIVDTRKPSGRQFRLGLNVDVKITTPELPAQITNGRGWFLADELRARKSEKFNDQGMVIERRGPIVIYSIGTQTHVTGADEMRVLYRPARRQIAVLLGRLSVQMKDFNQAEALAQKYHMIIEDMKESIHYVIVRPAPGVDLFSLANSLVQEEQVKSVQLETVLLDLVHK